MYITEVSQEQIPRILNVLELIQGNKTYYKKQSDVCKLISKTPNSTQILRGKNMGKICSDLIVVSVANHRYTDAVKLLWMLCQDKYCFVPSLFNGLMNVLLNFESNNKNEALWKIMCSMQMFNIMNKRDIRLEYLMLIFKSDMNSAQRSFMELSSQIRSTVLKKHDKLDPIFIAYADFLDYMTLTKTGSGHLSQNQEILGKVRLALKNFVENSGEWDIFILKLVKVLESYDQEDEIENLLFNYVNSNPSHINAYIYYCTYLQHKNPGSENLVKYLEILADLCPSDARVLCLVQIWIKQEIEMTKSLEYIFKFLDYPSNGENVTAWRLLLQVLNNLKNNITYKGIIEEMWDIRSRSWDWMYFNLNRHHQTQGSLLISYKITCLHYFNKKHKYIRKMQQEFPFITDIDVFSKKKCFFQTVASNRGVFD